MKSKQLKQRVTLIKRIITEDGDGHFLEKFVDLQDVWGCLLPLGKNSFNDVNDWGSLDVNANKHYFLFTMRKNNNTNALHADLYGLRFNSRVFKLISSFNMISEDVSISAVVMDEGKKGME